MDAWIIADTARSADRIRDTLENLSVDCPPSKVVAIDSVTSHAEELVNYDGFIILAASQLSPECFTLLQRLRATTHENATIIVVSSIENHGTVLNAVRSGASDFVTADEDLKEELSKSIDRFKSQRKNREVHGRVVSIVPCYDARDASFLSANLGLVGKRQILMILK